MSDDPNPPTEGIPLISGLGEKLQKPKQAPRLLMIAKGALHARGAGKQTAAQKHWESLRAHVHRGFFHSLLNQRANPTSDFLTMVSHLWTQVHKYSPKQGQKEKRDSTTEFVMVGWARIKEAQFVTARARGRNGGSISTGPGLQPKTTETSDPDANSSRPGFLSSDGHEPANIKSRVSTLGVSDGIFADPINDLDPVSEGEEEVGDDLDGGAGTSGRGSLGIEGLSLDTVPDVNISKVLKKIAQGLHNSLIDDADFFTVQVHLNRGWKLLLLGLTQAESIARYTAMFALRRAIPVINDTLLDFSTRENLVRVLIGLMVSDERAENRLKAVYLLGQLGFYLGSVKEHANLLMMAFKELAKKLLEIQNDEKRQAATAQSESDNEMRAMKIYLIHALGKLSRCVHYRFKSVEDLMIYMIHEEFVRENRRTSAGRKKTANSTNFAVLKSLLEILNNEMKRTEVNQRYIGAVFKSFVNPLMRSSNQNLQTLAVQFTSNWFPIMNEDAPLQGIEVLISGLKQTKTLGVQNFSQTSFDAELRSLQEKRQSEEARLATKARLVRQILAVPGTFSRLYPCESHPGFFFNDSCSMMNTVGLLAFLPLHPKSILTLTRPLPKKLKAARSKYEVMERTGGVPGLPFGYTYAPSQLVEVPHDPNASKYPQKIAETAQNASTLRKADVNDPSGKFLRRRPSKFYGNLQTGFQMSPEDKPEFPPGPRGRKMSMDVAHIAVPQREPTILNTNQAKRDGDVPYGTVRVPPKSDTMQIASRKIPQGFLPTCPFAGYDSDKFDRGILSLSAIYGRTVKKVAHGGEASVQVEIESYRPTETDVPPGFTTNKHPVLWPSKIPNLRNDIAVTDFPVNAPVVFDILQPGVTRMQRVLTRVVGTSHDLSVMNMDNQFNEEFLTPGAIFNIFIRERDHPTEWTSISLEVVDDDYEDASNLRLKTDTAGNANANNNLALAELSQTRASSSTGRGRFHGGLTSQINFPIPAGLTASGEAYFAPPINLPPYPVGYTSEGIPYFGRTMVIKPIPAGMTVEGIRFYNPDGKVPPDQGRNHVAGYDNFGQPFFIPRGCTVPPPVGFTTDGIPYYDISTMMLQRGVMVLPSTLKVGTAIPYYVAEDGSEEFTESGEPGSASDPRPITQKLIESLESRKARTNKNVLSERMRHTVEKLVRVSDFSQVQRKAPNRTAASLSEEWHDVAEPEAIMDFFRDSDALAYLKPTTIRVAMEPAVLEFQSMQAPVMKTALLRYRAGRGDHEERDFFVSVEPVDVFVVKQFHLRLQGEGVMEISVTFFPSSMKVDRVIGSINLIDESGKKLATCVMVAVRQSFVKVSPMTIDAGWILPDKRKECFLKIENISTTSTAVTFALHSDSKGNDEEATKNRPFVVPTRNLKMNPRETKLLSLFFEPVRLGQFSDVLEVRAPGGDIIKVQLVGIAGIPIAIYPEDEENSKAGAAALTRERCEFMKKFRRGEAKEKSHIPLTAEDTRILKNMMSATSDADSRKEAHTLDFGICPADSTTCTRCLTLLNLSDMPLTVALHPHSSHIKSPYLVRIAPRMANSVEITLDIGEGATAIRGNLQSAIEIICPEFQNIPLHVRAYVGQPLFFLSWEFAFFKPCRIGQKEKLNIVLVNESQYALSFALKGLSSSSQPEPLSNSFTCSVSADETELTNIPPTSTLSVTFQLIARQRGPILETIHLRVMSPFQIELPAAISNKTLTLIGICIEPYAHKQGEIPDKNGIDFLRTWMSHPKRLIDEYPSANERSQRFDTRPSNNHNSRSSTPHPITLTPDVLFAKDPLVFRPGLMSKDGDKQNADLSAFRRSFMQPVLAEHRGSQTIDVLFFASTCFTIDPRSKRMQAKDADNVDVIYMPPVNTPDFVSIYGFAVALQEQDHTFHAIQLQSKYFTDFLAFPMPTKDGVVVLDFGHVEISSNSLDINTKYVLLCNTYPTSYSWNVKFVSSKTKFSPFDAGMIMGELHPFETFALPFRFHCDTSGVFESVAEIYVKETMDRLVKPSKVASVVLRGQTTNTSLSGCPDSLDFGSTVVFQKKRKSFVISNNGTTEAFVHVLVRPPYQAEPKSFQLPPKGAQNVDVVYSPTESRSSFVKMLIFANQRVYIVRLTGTAGNAELFCEKYNYKDVDFGFQREGTVAYLSLYLTNKGTLPLCLKAVTADTPELIRVEYVNSTSTVPYEGNKINHSRAAVSVRKDYWSILRRKLRVFTVLKELLRRISRMKLGSNNLTRTDASWKEDGVGIKVYKTSSINVMDHSLFPLIPHLRPFYSYHFRVGYYSKYQPKRETDLYFHFMPITTEEDPTTLPSLLKRMKLHVVGNVYRPLEIFPPYHDFGLVPAEAYIDPRSIQRSQKFFSSAYGVVREGQQQEEPVVQLEVLNMSMEAQNLGLQFLTPGFTISGRTWHIQPGEKLFIPVEFHPEKEQAQYRGEARFVHNFGVVSVRFAGTGASADLTCEPCVDFGSLKLGTIASREFKLSNRGLLECKFSMEIIQTGLAFKWVWDDPVEIEGTISPGGTASYNVECTCQPQIEESAYIHLRWLRVPRGIWEQIYIPLKVQVGMPAFKIQLLEVDFQTTYINVNKTIELSVTNDGNANCMWEAECDTSVLTVEPDMGGVAPGETIYLDITFKPLNYEPLASAIAFHTDAGKKTVMCYGIVGIPYLNIPPEQLHIDFGIIEVKRKHVKPLVLNNTGPKRMEVEVSFFKYEQDGIEADINEFAVFSAEPARTIVEPGASFTIKLHCTPQSYNAIYSVAFVIRTADGEQYIGQLAATGGKAIIKIAPPSLDQIPSKSRPPTARMSRNKAVVTNSTGSSKLLDAAKLSLASHFENLHEVLAGLRAAELDSYMGHIEGRNDTAGEFLTSRGEAAFDGSDMRLRVRSSRTFSKSFKMDESRDKFDDRNLFSPEDVSDMVRSRSRRGQLPDTVESSLAMQYMDDLTRFEYEIEAALASKKFGEPNYAQRAREVGGLGAYIPGSPHRRFSPIPDGNEDEGTFDSSRVSSAATSEGSSRKESATIRKPVEEMMTGFMQKVEEAVSSDDPEMQRSMLASINEYVLSKTHDIIQAVREQLENQSLQNREFLVAALRKLNQSTHVIEELGATTTNNLSEVDNDFNLGLFRGGEQSSLILLFNLPNMGNLSFNFTIERADGHRICPAAVDVSSAGHDFFIIQPDSGSIFPQQSVNFSAMFTAEIEGVYQQGFNLCSNNEKILSFTLTAKVGNPHLAVNTGELTFGLVHKGEKAVRSFIVSNVGTFPDTWHAVIENGSDSKTSSRGPFTVLNDGGTLEPGRESAIQVVFNPSAAGDYTSIITLQWSKIPLNIKLAGVGGDAKLEVRRLDQEPSAGNGIDFGTCLLGKKYETSFHVYNSGNVPGQLEVSYKSSQLQVEASFAGNGLLSVRPDESVPIRVIYRPLVSETLADNLILRIVSGYLGTVLEEIPVKALSGFCSWRVDGDLSSFINMHTSSTQSKSISVCNDGELEIAINLRLEPESLSKITHLTLDGEDKTVLDRHFTTVRLPPKKATQVQVNISPLSVGLIEGQLILSTDLGEGPTSKEFPFRFRSYEKQVTLDDSSDINMGRIMVAEKVTATRTLLNYSSTKIKFRAHIAHILELEVNERPNRTISNANISASGSRRPSIRRTSSANISKSASKTRRKSSGNIKTSRSTVRIPSGRESKSPQGKRSASRRKSRGSIKNMESAEFQNPWSIENAAEGYVPAEDSVPIVVAFIAPDKESDNGHEYKLIIETCQDEEDAKWSEVASLRLSGASGKPRLQVDPQLLDFSHCPLKTEKQMHLTLRSEGTATVSYEIEEPWDFCNVFQIAEDTTGRLEPGQVTCLHVTFKPDAEMEYTTKFKIKTQLSTVEVLLGGHGAIYRLDRTHLPDVLDMGHIMLGNIVEKRVELKNDCQYPIQVHAAVKKVNLTPLASKESDRFAVTPDMLWIDVENAQENKVIGRQSPGITVRTKAPLPLIAGGLGDSPAIRELVSQDATLYCLQLIVSDGDAHIIPIHLKYEALPPLVLHSSGYQFMMNRGHAIESDMLGKFEFGEKPITLGATSSMIVHNPNNFGLRLSILSTEKVTVDTVHIDFGVVGVSSPEVRTVTLNNPTNSPIHLMIHSSDEDFRPEFSELQLDPMEHHALEIFFYPTEIGRDYKGKISFASALGDDDSEILAWVEVQGAGGDCSFGVLNETKEGEQSGNHTDSSKTALELFFPKVPENSSVKKQFEVENTGSTVIELEVVDHLGQECVPRRDIAATNISYRIEPHQVLVQPKSRQRFTINLKGLKVGEDEVEIVIRTRKLVVPKIIPVKIKAFVVDGVSVIQANLKVFARADDSIEEILSLHAQEENRSGTDLNLWKILLPIIRISPKLPSMEIDHVPMIEPNVRVPDVRPFVVRPPAIPRELPNKTRKWYMNRVSLALDQNVTKYFEDKKKQPDSSSQLKKEFPFNECDIPDFCKIPLLLGGSSSITASSTEATSTFLQAETLPQTLCGKTSATTVAALSTPTPPIDPAGSNFSTIASIPAPSTLIP
ncbi:hypothetical protein HK102_009083 [Quaeritorhiza haematococci]|nr:hypothetical protein HK102_009083 [Quaeritorhiza haematococci]